MEWPKVTQILEARLDGEDNPAQRLELLRHLGDVQESHLEDLDGALETYGRLFAEDPHDLQSQETLTRLARSLGRWIGWRRSSTRRFERSKWTTATPRFWR